MGGIFDFATKFFGTKYDKDLKLITPIVKKIKLEEEKISLLSNDDLRKKTILLKDQIHSHINSEREEIEGLKIKAEDTETSFQQKENYYSEIDNLEKEIIDKIEEVLKQILPQAFAVMKETAKRFTDNSTIEVTANDFDRDDLGNIIGNKNLEGRDLQKFILTNPTTGEEYEFDADALVGEDWTGMSQNADAIFSSEEIEKYYDKAMDMKLNEANDFPDGLGPEIKHDWIQEIWDRVNPGIKILSHSINTNNDSSWLPKWQINSWTGNEYTVIVYLTPDMQPEDGGALELWTPNLNDKMKAMACNTLYTFDAEQEYNQDILYSFWPMPGRQVVFDSRIPYIARPVNGDKTCVSIVFKGTSKDYAPESTATDEIEFIEVE